MPSHLLKLLLTCHLVLLLEPQALGPQPLKLQLCLIPPCLRLMHSLFVLPLMSTTLLVLCLASLVSLIPFWILRAWLNLVLLCLPLLPIPGFLAVLPRPYLRLWQLLLLISLLHPPWFLVDPVLVLLHRWILLLILSVRPPKRRHGRKRGREEAGNDSFYFVYFFVLFPSYLQCFVSSCFVWGIPLTGISFLTLMRNRIVIFVLFKKL